MSKKFATLAVTGILAAASASPAAVIFTENFEDASVLSDPQWSANAGGPTYGQAPVARGNVSFQQGDGITSRIGRGFTVNPAATSVKMTWEMYTTTATGLQRYHGQLSSGTAAAPGTGNGGFARVGANNDANNRYNFLYSNGATQTVVTTTPYSTGWHTISLTVIPATKQYIYQIDNNPAQTITSTGNVLMPTNVQLGQNVSNGATGGDDTTAWFDNIVVEQFAPAAAPVTNTTPVDDATGVDSTQPLALSWAGGANTSSYDVYFGTDPLNLSLASAAQPGTSHQVASLQPQTEYFWRVDPRNVLGDATTGAVFSFTTAAVPEPAAISLSALAALALMGRRRQKA